MVYKIIISLLFFSLPVCAGEIEHIAKSYAENSLLMSPSRRLKQEKKKDIILNQLPCEIGSDKIVIKLPEKKFKKEECLATSKIICSKCAYGIMVGSPFVGILGMFCIAGNCIPMTFKSLASFGGITFGMPTACLCGQKIYYSCCDEDISQETKEKNINN